MANIEIDGKKIQADLGMMIIEAADEHDIWIPRFCYHKKLSIAANCRMCLVDVEKSAKPLPACATPITDGMKIWTKSNRAIQAQKSVMEFLLINHPLDCPICDQGGECELQDISLGYGNDVSRFSEKKRVVADQDLGPLIATDMTRCIHCTRCVRFGAEISGVRELGAVGRGEHMEIGTFIEQNVESEVSGNVIELCPVGALTSKPYRFTARGWELQQKPSIGPHDCVGANIYVHTRRNEVMRVVPRENEAINEIWISDRDRYSYTGLYTERLALPKIKQNGKFETVSWSSALNYTVESLKKIIQAHSPESIGALLSPNSSIEEAYLLQKWIRGLGSQNIDHRLRQVDFRDQKLAPAFPHMGVTFKELETQSLVLLVGSLIRQEQPTLALKLRKVTQAQGKVMVINPVDCAFNFDVAEKSIAEAGDLVAAFAKVAKALLHETTHKIPAGAMNWLASVPSPSETDLRMAQALLNNVNNEKAVILLGALALNHPEASRLIALANLIKEITGAKVGVLTEGANAAGAWLAGAIPHRLSDGQDASPIGFNAREMWLNKLKAYVLLGVEPAFDCGDPIIAQEALERADFVVAITAFENPQLEAVADVLLPGTPFTETSGTYINAAGIWQTFQGVALPYKESRPSWKILRVLGNLCELSGFDYNNTEEILTVVKNEQKRGFTLESWDWSCPSDIRFAQKSTAKLTRIAPVPLYAGDSLVRRATPLQKTHAAGPCEIRMNPNTATHLGLQQNKQAAVELTGQNIVLPLVLDANIPEQAVLIPAGLPGTEKLPPPYTPLEIKSAIGEQE